MFISYSCILHCVIFVSYLGFVDYKPKGIEHCHKL